MGLGVAETVADAVVAAAGASVATDETGSAFFQGLVLGSGASTYFTGAGGEAVVDAPEPVGNIRFNIIGTQNVHASIFHGHCDDRKSYNATSKGQGQGLS